jgi:hypothetical protein
MGGMYNATIYANDANSNFNKSDVVLFFNVTSIATTDKDFYQRNDNILIEGR